MIGDYDTHFAHINNFRKISIPQFKKKVLIQSRYTYLYYGKIKKIICQIRTMININFYY
jgi:hypothetical protein